MIEVFHNIGEKLSYLSPLAVVKCFAVKMLILLIIAVLIFENIQVQICLILTNDFGYHIAYYVLVYIYSLATVCNVQQKPFYDVNNCKVTWCCLWTCQLFCAKYQCCSKYCSKHLWDENFLFSGQQFIFLRIFISFLSPFQSICSILMSYHKTIFVISQLFFTERSLHMWRTNRKIFLERSLEISEMTVAMYSSCAYPSISLWYM